MSCSGFYRTPKYLVKNINREGLFKRIQNLSKEFSVFLLKPKNLNFGGHHWKQVSFGQLFQITILSEQLKSYSYQFSFIMRFIRQSNKKGVDLAVSMFTLFYYHRVSLFFPIYSAWKWVMYLKLVAWINFVVENFAVSHNQIRF